MTSWLIYLMLLKAHVSEICSQESECIEEVMDCVLDGEELSFCAGSYKNEK